MKRKPHFFRLSFYALAVLILSFLSVVFKSCSKSKTADKINSVQLANNPTLGTYLADNKGYTLYYFSNDVDGGINKCTGGCLDLWPIFYDSLLSAATLGTGLNASDFTTITTTLGTRQTAYKGWPLYYYAPKDASGKNVRENPGQTTGEKIGNIWYVVKTDYTIMIANKKVGISGTTDSTTKEFLTDSAGNTLYYFSKDSTSPSTLPANCTGTCIATWPVFYTPNLNLPSLLNKADFASITRTDGPNGTTRLQSTFKGRPLYYYTPDNKTRGAAKGEGVGKIWFVMKPDVTKIN
jgi:predicted lipoprotein with Yx(FWY)xxD motif